MGQHIASEAYSSISWAKNLFQLLTCDICNCSDRSGRITVADDIDFPVYIVGGEVFQVFDEISVL